MKDKKMKMGKGSKQVKGMMPMGYKDGGKVGKAKAAPFMKGKKMADGGMAKGKKGC